MVGEVSTEDETLESLGSGEKCDLDPELVVSTLVSCVTLETMVTLLSVVASEVSSVSIVLLKLECEVLPGPKLVSTRLVVSTRTWVLSDIELALVER